jgi:hypothetical protein
MAHAIVEQKIVDGDKITVVKYTIKGDGASGELSDAVLFDASSFKTGSISNKLMEIEYCLNGFSAELKWDATTDVALISLAKDRQEKACFWNVGGLVNNGAAGRTGDILISTLGLATKTYDGYILLYLIERDVTKFTTK